MQSEPASKLKHNKCKQVDIKLKYNKLADSAVTVDNPNLIFKKIKKKFSLKRCLFLCLLMTISS